jgi:hypothetical protein
MSVFDRIQQIKTQSVGATGARVLLVEGSDDVAAYRIFLSHRAEASGWEKKWHIEPAGNKRQVLAMLKHEPTWLGIVDRDEWTPAECQAVVQEVPNLVLLPRFCLESYLVDPQEIWPALGPIQQAKVLGGLPTLESAITAQRAHWVRHAALWHTINPLWHELRGKGFKEGVLDPAQQLSNEDLLTVLKGWHDTLDAQTILAAVQAREAQLLAMPNTELLTQWVYAKKFYPMVVHTALNQLLGQMTEKDRRLKLLRHMAQVAVPADLAPLWLAMNV